MHGISEMRLNCAPRISCSPFLFRTQERVDTILLVCPGRLSWRHRARPSATLHEIQARSQGANLNDPRLTRVPEEFKWVLRTGTREQGTGNREQGIGYPLPLGLSLKSSCDWT